MAVELLPTVVFIVFTELLREVIEPSALVTRVVRLDTFVAFADISDSASVRSDCSPVIAVP